MNTEVLFENKENILTITINKNSDYIDIKDKVISILDASGPSLFNNVQEPIIIKGKRLSDFEEQELRNIFAGKTSKSIFFEKPKRLGVATINSIFNKDATITNCKVFTGTVRSGQRVEFEGTVILLGDVNAGSEVVAEQNIIVVGDIRGHVHAGAKGNRSCFIAANSINPTQLRIADLDLKKEDKIDFNNGYEIAKISMGEITIEQ
jgi:septum site-determining protein MinC